MATLEHEMNTPLPDFDVLVALYRHDPEAFEDFRRHVLREAVDCAPACHRPALERLLESIEVQERPPADRLFGSECFLAGESDLLTATSRANTANRQDTAFLTSEVRK